MSLSWRILAAVVAAQAGAVSFLVAAQRQDLVSRPDWVRTDTPEGIHLDVVARPFALGRCIPLTTSYGDEPYQSADEILGEPVYRCTGWHRPIGWAAAGAAIAALIVVLLGRIAGSLRRGAL